MANPDQRAYYFWQNKPTSAHYYINKQGVPEGEACTWGSGGSAVGNWAPLIFGTSWDDMNTNTGYSSLKQNELIWNDRADFTATFVGDETTNPCKYDHVTQNFCQNGGCGRDLNCTVSCKFSCRSSTDGYLVGIYQRRRHPHAYLYRVGGW